MSYRAPDATVFVSAPEQFCEDAPIVDELKTRTSDLQQQTVEECLSFLCGISGASPGPTDLDAHGRPRLTKSLHIDFAKDTFELFPAPFVGIDASRPWFIYWALTTLHLLGEDVTIYRHRVFKSFHMLQNAGGGYGGGQGHFSHLAATYAALLSLGSVGGNEAYQSVDRKAMWRWLGKLKLSNGGFIVSENGEEDVRGAYCALVAISLLNLPWSLPEDSPAREAGLSTFGDGLGEYLSRCQTYEGGVAAAPGLEAHGAYTFCALACLCLLDAPHRALQTFLDLDALLRWLSARQYALEGGLAGRTNKLVDGCYSHWIGGCWPLVQAALLASHQSNTSTEQPVDIFSSDGLSRYILACCQAPSGGLRDKPSMRPDICHTCYNLAGLSVTEHASTYRDLKPTERFSTAFSWTTIPKAIDHTSVVAWGNQDEAMVKALHPVFVISHHAVDLMRKWAMAQPSISDL